MSMSANVILTSDFPSNPHPLVVARIRAVARSPRVAWIAPASPDRHARFVEARRAFGALGVANLKCVELAPSSSGGSSVIKDVHVIYLSGGDPILFRTHLATSGLDAQVVAFAAGGGLIVAASGGAMQLTQNLSLYRLLCSDVDDVVATREAYSGLAVVGVEFLPHLNRHSKAFMAKVREYSEAVPHDILALEDGGALWWGEDGDLSCAGRAVRVRRGVMSPLDPAG